MSSSVTRLERLSSCHTEDDKWRLLYTWVKQDVITSREFVEWAKNIKNCPPILYDEDY